VQSPRFWREASEARRTWLIAVVLAAVTVIVAVGVYLVVDRPWESRGYKDCVRNAERQLQNEFSTSQIKAYCHELYR
jgi:hypothetical protein